MSEVVGMSVASNIRSLRKKNGLTQEELADMVGVSRSTVTQWERDWSSPRMGMVQRLAKALNVPTTAIVSESGPEPDYRLSEITDIYRSVSEAGRNALLASARGIREMYSGKTVAEVSVDHSE